ncbi:PREDICTED: uncharacterized protein LOC104824963 [Tarenaya hassleriana]|uniref:uncharacterized protein LOC104824963 n=1 Tax=Tarenaya hassleriana TaxID=28532 RepID=UPI00053C48FA|nr:PREDICTED: uncharacterized protein LOC104824963 [Tarenaya hassleriana]
MEAVSKQIPITLNGENYFFWSKAAKATFSSKGLWSHITDGEPLSPHIETVGEAPVNATQPRPTGNEEKAKWHQDDQLALVLLQGSLDATVLQSFISMESAKGLWNALKEVYGNLSNISRIYEIKKKMAQLQQQGNPFTKLQGLYTALWNELEEIRPPTVDARVCLERTEEDKVFGLLLALDPSFNDLVYHVLRQSKLPSFFEVCMMVNREEGGRNLFGGPLAMANYSYRHPPILSTPKEKRVPTCAHCKKLGHIKEKCWILNPHLKPTRYRDTSQPKGAAMSAGNTISFTQEEFKNFVLSMKDKESGNFSSLSTPHIVVDSGATSHMFHDKSLFFKLENSFGMVTVANGKYVSIRGHGY